MKPTKPYDDLTLGEVKEELMGYIRAFVGLTEDDCVPEEEQLKGLSDALMALRSIQALLHQKRYGDVLFDPSGMDRSQEPAAEGLVRTA